MREMQNLVLKIKRDKGRIVQVGDVFYVNIDAVYYDVDINKCTVSKVLGYLGDSWMVEANCSSIECDGIEVINYYEEDKKYCRLINEIESRVIMMPYSETNEFYSISSISINTKREGDIRMSINRKEGNRYSAPINLYGYELLSGIRSRLAGRGVRGSVSFDYIRNCSVNRVVLTGFYAERLIDYIMMSVEGGKKQFVVIEKETNDETGIR